MNSTDTDVTQNYDVEWSGTWNDARVIGPTARHSRRLFLAMTADLSPNKIVDIGCGEGSLLAALGRMHSNASLTGFEISDKALSLAQLTLPNAEFSQLDVEKDTCERTFDLVVSADVIEHIKDDETAIANIAKMTAPGGRVVLSTLRGRMRDFERDIGHVRNYADRELQNKLAGAGLKVELELAWGFPFFSPIYRDLLNFLGNKGTVGKFGLGRRIVCNCLYWLFCLNSSRRGDYLFVRAVKEN